MLNHECDLNGKCIMMWAKMSDNNCKTQSLVQTFSELNVCFFYLKKILTSNKLNCIFLHSIN